MELVRGPGAGGALEPRLPPQFPFYVDTAAGAGRRLVADREIRPGETVLTGADIMVDSRRTLVLIIVTPGRLGDRPRPRLGQRLHRVLHQQPRPAGALPQLPPPGLQQLRAARGRGVRLPRQDRLHPRHVQHRPARQVETAY